MATSNHTSLSEYNLDAALCSADLGWKPGARPSDLIVIGGCSFASALSNLKSDRTLAHRFRLLKVRSH